MFKKFQFQVISCLTLLSTLTTFSMPNLSAQEYIYDPQYNEPVYNQQECCDSDWSDTWTLARSGLIGVVAGGITAYAISSRGHNGKNGTNGATGSNGTNGATGANGINGTNGTNGTTGATGTGFNIVVDPNHTLTFSFQNNISYNATPPGATANWVEYVVDPALNVYTSNTFSQITGNPITIISTDNGSITNVPAMSGDYIVGIRYTNPFSTIASINPSPTGVVFIQVLPSSTTGVQDTYVGLNAPTIADTSTFLAGPGSAIEVTGIYTYNPTGSHPLFP